MNDEQFISLMSTTVEEFYDPEDYKDGFYSRLMQDADQNRFNETFLFSVMMRNVMEDVLDATRLWSMSYDRNQEPQEQLGSPMTTTGELFDQIEGIQRKYAKLGFRYGLVVDKPKNKKTAEVTWKDIELNESTQWDRLVETHYDTASQREMACMYMLHTAQKLTHSHQEEIGSTWVTFLGGCSFALFSVLIQTWVSGERIASSYLTATALEGAFDEQ